MVKYISYFIVALITVSCSFFSEKKLPEDVMTKDKLVEVLVDVHIADATLTILALHKKDKTFHPSVFYQQVLEKHNVTREQFDVTLKHYSKKPQEFDKIYEQVLSELSKRKALLLKEEEQKNSK